MGWKLLVAREEETLRNEKQDMGEEEEGRGGEQNERQVKYQKRSMEKKMKTGRGLRDTS